MKLDLNHSRVTKCEFKNEMPLDSEMRLEVKNSNRIDIPKQPDGKGTGKITERIMVGSPMTPLYLFVEQICVFSDTEGGNWDTEDTETLMSIYKTVCRPVAKKEMEKTLKAVCAAYQIPEIKMQ